MMESLGRLGTTAVGSTLLDPTMRPFAPMRVNSVAPLRRRASSSALTACSSVSGSRSDAILAVCESSSRMRTPSAVRLRSSASSSASSMRTSNQLSIPRCRNWSEK